VARLASVAGAWLAFAGSAALAGEPVLVEAGSSTTWVAHFSDPGFGESWVSPGFDDRGWTAGTYGIGYDSGGAAAGLIATEVPAGASSIYTRAWFTLDDSTAVATLHLGADFDDGWAAWINGVEVYRSPQLPAGPLAWNMPALEHESSNGTVADYAPLVDVSLSGVPLLNDGPNLLAVAVWNTTSESSDLVLVPQLVANKPIVVTRGPYLQSASPSSVVVRWRTQDPSTSQVRFGPAPDQPQQAAAAVGLVHEHEIAVTGLEPSTRY